MKRAIFFVYFLSILTIVWLSIGSVPALNKLTPANHLVERAAMLRDLKRQKEEVGLTIIWIVSTSVTLCSKLASSITSTTKAQNTSETESQPQQLETFSEYTFFIFILLIDWLIDGFIFRWAFGTSTLARLLLDLIKTRSARIKELSRSRTGGLSRVRFEPSLHLLLYNK